MEGNMTDKKTELTTEYLLAHAFVRLTTLENLLVEKGLLTREELAIMNADLSEKLIKAITKNLNLINGLSGLSDTLSDEKKN